MKYYTLKNDVPAKDSIVLEDMLLTIDQMPTTAGSKMLEGYQSLFEAEAVTKLKAAGFAIGGKAKVGEFNIDLLGETGFDADEARDGTLKNASAEILKAGEAMAVVGLDVNGAIRRAAAQNDLISVKPTYGTVSRYGTIPVACSGETVSVLASDTEKAAKVLDVLAGHDDKDGTSLSEEKCAAIKTTGNAANLKKAVVLSAMLDGADEAVKNNISAFCDILKNAGVEVTEIKGDVIPKARIAWNILMSAELCNNVSRYDGVKYGYRTENYENIDELYTNSRTEAFGELLKTAILFGSETLSTKKYQLQYDKALRIRRVICEEFASIFEDADLVIMPAVSAMTYPAGEDKYKAYKENFYTAPASITGLPAVVAGGVQLIGKAFSENTLFAAAKLYEAAKKEGK